MAGWDTDQALEIAWLGGNGPEEEAEAEKFLQACLDDDERPEIQADVEEMVERLDRYVEEGHPIREALVADLQRQDAEADGDGENEDHFVGLIAAELERVADHIGRGLTPKETDELLRSIPQGARNAEEVFPDWVAAHGDRLKGRVEKPVDRQDLMGERFAQVKARAAADDGEEPYTGETLERPEDERQERMAAVFADAKEGGE